MSARICLQSVKVFPIIGRQAGSLVHVVLN